MRIDEDLRPVRPLGHLVRQPRIPTLNLLQWQIAREGRGVEAELRRSVAGDDVRRLIRGGVVDVLGLRALARGGVEMGQAAVRWVIENRRLEPRRRLGRGERRC